MDVAMGQQMAVGNEQLQTPLLKIPHPRLAERRFVLQPWKEIAPEFVVPLPFDSSVDELLRVCEDQGTLVKTAYELLD